MKIIIYATVLSLAALITPNLAFGWAAIIFLGSILALTILSKV